MREVGWAFITAVILTALLVVAFVAVNPAVKGTDLRFEKQTVNTVSIVVMILVLIGAVVVWIKKHWPHVFKKTKENSKANTATAYDIS